MPGASFVGGVVHPFGGLGEQFVAAVHQTCELTPSHTIQTTRVPRTAFVGAVIDTFACYRHNLCAIDQQVHKSPVR